MAIGSQPETPDAAVCVAPGFEPVAKEFARQLSLEEELGAAFCAIVDGSVVVDLWGGTADPSTSKPWKRDTMQLIFSGSKGLVAGCVLLLVDRGVLDLGARVADYWPEFGRAGKEDVRVEEVMSHTCRMPGFARPLSVDELVDDRRMAQLLAEQPQFADPRARQTYHPLTYGWLCGELVRRVDGRSIGEFFADEFAKPMGLEVFIGLPSELEHRVARLELAQRWGQRQTFAAELATGGSGDQLMTAVWGNPAVFVRRSFPWNSGAYHQAEIPAANAIGTARSIARFYANLDQIISPELFEAASKELASRHDPLLGETQRYGVGFELQTEARPFGPPADGFGHTGAGGSVHGLWPTARVGFSYVANLMRDDDLEDGRPSALLEALFGCLDVHAPHDPGAA